MAYRSFSFIPTLSNNRFSDRFAQMDNLFSRLTGEKPLADTPSYNLLKKNKNYYELTVSVPGYMKDELDILVLNNQLTISGKSNCEKNALPDEKEGVKWLHQGINKNDFSLNFNLEHRIKIQQSNLDKGLLTLHFTYDIPEEAKPQKITIGMNNKSDCVVKHISS